MSSGCSVRIRRQAITLFLYILRELIPQFFVSVCVLSAVIVVSQLIRLSDVLVTFGVSLENIFLPFLFILLPFLSFSIPIAFLFAVLLSFSRLSADGEYTAMLAAGYSLKRLLLPVMIIASMLYVTSVFSSMYFEPWGRRETLEFYRRKAQTELDNVISVKLKSGVFVNDFLGYVLYAEEISEDRSQLDKVMLAPGDNAQEQNFTLFAPKGSISGSVENGDLKMAFEKGVLISSKLASDSSSVVRFDRAELDLLGLFQEQIFGPDATSDDYRSYNPSDLWQYLSEQKDKLSTMDSSIQQDYYKARFLFHQRFSLPFSCIIFAFFAMVLGIQDERKGKSHGYIGAILTVVASYVLLMGFKYLAEKNTLAAPLAAWLPNVLLGCAGIFLVSQKNRLPPSESTLDPIHIPGLRWFFLKKKSLDKK